MNYFEEWEMILAKSEKKRKIIKWIGRVFFNADTERACLPWNYKGVTFDIKKGRRHNKDGAIMTKIPDSYSSQI